eukprot:SAG31_NODE_2592_length_5424_cov_1.685258_3_plen_68_part_00
MASNNGLHFSSHLRSSPIMSYHKVRKIRKALQDRMDSCWTARMEVCMLVRSNLAFRSTHETSCIEHC